MVGKSCKIIGVGKIIIGAIDGDVEIVTEGIKDVSTGALASVLADKTPDEDEKNEDSTVATSYSVVEAVAYAVGSGASLVDADDMF